MTVFERRFGTTFRIFTDFKLTLPLTINFVIPENSPPLKTDFAMFFISGFKETKITTKFERSQRFVSMKRENSMLFRLKKKRAAHDFNFRISQITSNRLWMIAFFSRKGRSFVPPFIAFNLNPSHVPHKGGPKVQKAVSGIPLLMLRSKARIQIFLVLSKSK